MNAFLISRWSILVALSGVASAQAPGIPVFSVSWRSPTVSVPDSFTATPITEGDLLAAPGLTPAFGPTPQPGIVESGGALAPAGLFVPGHGPCVGHAGGTPCAIEVDALSHALDWVVDCNTAGLAPPRWAFSVSWRAIGDPASDVRNEAMCAEEGADLYMDNFSPCGPNPPTPSFGNTQYVDGNGIANCNGTGLVPGLGLIEPAPGDDLDAVDDDVADQFVPRMTCTYFSLDSAFLDPGFGTNNSGSAVANGFVGGDVLMSCPGCAPAVYAPAGLLGLDAGGPDTDDLDALALRENGIAGYQRSITPYDWTSGASDMLFFSVRRGSAIVGTPDAFFGLPIEPGDILVPTGAAGSPPGIWIAAETIGLWTQRSAPGSVSDDLDALDVLHDPQPGTGFCAGDGSGTACPCLNFGAPGHGCANSVNPLGGYLWANGMASIANDTVHFTCSGLPGSATALLFQGTNVVNGGNGAVFGDGLRCVAGSVVRLYKQPALCGNREFGHKVPGDVAVSIAGGVSPGVYNYQVWYRNGAAFCTPATWNLTNAYRITWAP